MSVFRTTNDAAQYESTGSRAVDFFYAAPVQRMAVLTGEDNLIELYEGAKKEDLELATKTVFWLRDPRSGAGERAAGIKLLKYLAEKQPLFVYDNMQKIAEYGRWKDLEHLQDSHGDGVAVEWAKAIKKGDRLAAKWAPRKGKLARAIRDELGITNASYRKVLKQNSETVEQFMCSKDWTSIEYTKVPSVAMRKYGKAFRRNDEQRFTEFIGDDTKKINTAVNYPHEVLRHAHKDIDLADKMWANLPNYIAPGKNIMPVVDVSGSMTWKTIDKAGSRPIDVAIALGLYISERNVGPFANQVITFSDSPQWASIDPKSKLHEKMLTLLELDWKGSTNIEKTYMLILKLATALSIPQEEMPTTLLILSDMQFDSCSRDADKTHLDNVQEQYKTYGYETPKIVFWNLAGSFKGSPADIRDNVALIAGFSPTILEAVLQEKLIDPIGVLRDAVAGYNINFDHFDPEV